jgi:chromate transporter
LASVWNRYGGTRWQAILERALAPIATGLILSGAFAVLRSSTDAAFVWAIVIVSAGIFGLYPKLNPLPVLLAAGVLGALAGALS